MELARQFKPHRFERTRLDGMTLEIRGNPMPGGGFVTTYTDITERKQPEAEMHQANESLANANIRATEMMEEPKGPETRLRGARES